MGTGDYLSAIEDHNRLEIIHGLSPV